MGRLIAGTADSDIRTQLGALGIGYLWVTGASDDITSRIDNTPGTGHRERHRAGDGLAAEPAGRPQHRGLRGRHRTAGGPTGERCPRASLIASCRSARRPTRAGRRASTGSPLTPVDGGWQQAYALPAAGGSATWAIPSTSGWLLIGQGALLLVAAVLAAPGVRRPEVRDPTKSARRAATLSELV